MARAADLARGRGVPLVLLSGLFGLLEAQAPIPWYDHALGADEVAALVPRVAARLRLRRATGVLFVCAPADAPGWAPYHRVVEAACAAAGVTLARHVEAPPFR